MVKLLECLVSVLMVTVLIPQGQQLKKSVGFSWKWICKVWRHRAPFFQISEIATIKIS